MMSEKLDLDALEARMYKLVNVAGASVQTTPETVLALIARVRELESASQPGGGEAEWSWEPITRSGQLSEGDKIRFTIGQQRYTETVKCVLDAGTDAEEIIYNLRKNFYFITSMAVGGSSSHKNVQVRRAAPSAGNGGAEGDGK